MITSEMKVLAYKKPYHGATQKLVRIYRIFGVKVWTKVIDTEEVPAWATIQNACLGSTDWRSKFAEYIK